MEGEGDNVACDQVTAELISMGFEFSDVAEAINAVGPSLDMAVEYILNDSRMKSDCASSSSISFARRGKSLRKYSESSLKSVRKMRQSSIVKLLDSGSRPTRRKITIESDVSASKSRTLGSPKESFPFANSNALSTTQTLNELIDQKDAEGIGSDWEEKAKEILCKHFGYSSLKPFQKEALSAWITYKDCLVLAATGSGILSFSYIYAHDLSCDKVSGLCNPLLHFSRCMLGFSFLIELLLCSQKPNTSGKLLVIFHNNVWLKFSWTLNINFVFQAF